MISDILRQAQRFTVRNSPAILTGVAVVGTATTAVLSAKGAFRAAEILEKSELNPSVYKKSRKQTLKEHAQLTWKCYIPAVSTGAVTVACIVSANRIGANRAAAIAAAYTISERAFVEYKDKVVEKVGETKERRIHDDVMQDRIDKNPPPQSLIVNESDKQICYDSYSGRYFLSTMEELKSAQNRLNHRMLQDDYASLSDFYGFIGLESTQFSDDIGWNVDNLLEIEFTSCLTPEQKPAIAMHYRVEPIRGFHRLR